MNQSLTGDWGRFYQEEKLIWTRAPLLPHDFSLGRVWPWHTVWGRSLLKCQKRDWKQNKLPAGLPARPTRKLPSGLPEKSLLENGFHWVPAYCWLSHCRSKKKISTLEPERDTSSSHSVPSVPPPIKFSIMPVGKGDNENHPSF